MKVGLFIPCYVDQLYPEVGIATYELLKRAGLNVIYPTGQTCCGQPMANSGFENSCTEVYKHFVDLFRHCDYIVTPSGSCAYHIKNHYSLIHSYPGTLEVSNAMFELTDFLTDILDWSFPAGSFPHVVGLHLSCHGQRGLKQANCSEVESSPDGKVLRLLKTIDGIKITNLHRTDECCGFGGTFCVTEEAVSSRMGIDRVMDHFRNGTEVLTGTDMSCLMHLSGIIDRNKLPIKVMHVAEILNGAKL